MLPIPAIDVLDGRVVRLLRGDFTRVAVYSDDPVAVASAYVAAGARRIHLVDLSGARHGDLDRGLVERIGGAVPDLQVGGGIRSVAVAAAALEAGATRVVVGSLAVSDPPGLARMAAAIGGGRVVVAVDVRDGRARGQGWTDRGVEARRVVDRAVDTGCGSLLVTAIDRDGTMAGPDLDLLRSVRVWAPTIEIIASGGVSTLDDLDAAARAGADAAVVGRALLEGAFTVADAMSR